MSTPENLDAQFQQAVTAIDSGDENALKKILATHPHLLHSRLDSPGAWLRDKVGRAVEPNGFFARPYLLWFVAEDPVRNNKLPKNIAEIARIIIEAAKKARVDNLQEQLDYAMSLVAWSWVSRECGVQLALIDVLADAGAKLDGNPENALVNHNFAAAEHLIKRGAKLNLAVALILERWDDAARLAPTTNPKQRQFAFVLCALNGKAEALRRLLAFGVDLNAPSESLYSHGTPLHHAVCSSSLDAVKVLVEAGANLSAKDTVHQATPLGWANYASEDKDEERKKLFTAIAAYLREKGAK